MRQTSTMRRAVIVLLGVAATALGGDLLGRAVLGADLVSLARASRATAPAPSPSPATPVPLASVGPREPRIDVECDEGVATVAVSNGWHANREAPWKWDAGRRVAVDERLARFEGAACTGTIKAFVCDDIGEWCKGPIRVAVR
jgi:hypothetical protein